MAERPRGAVVTPEGEASELLATVAPMIADALAAGVAPQAIVTTLAAGVAPGAMTAALIAVGYTPRVAVALAAKAAPAITAALQDAGEGITEIDQGPEEAASALAAVKVAAASAAHTDPAIVSVGKEGRVTLPARIRELLDLEEGDRLVLDVDREQGSIRLRPAVTVPRQLAWVYTQEHLSQLARALADVAQGRVSEPSEEEVTDLLGEPQPDEVLEKGK
jgi:antitoxin MazE